MHQQPSNWESSFFKHLYSTLQPLAVSIEFLQGLITVYKITISGFMKLHVMNTLMSQLFVLILKYLSGIYLPVHDFLQVGLRCLQLVNTCLQLCRQLAKA
jgi:hypothetical protein